MSLFLRLFRSVLGICAQNLITLRSAENANRHAHCFLLSNSLKWRRFQMSTMRIDSKTGSQNYGYKFFEFLEIFFHLRICPFYSSIPCVRKEKRRSSVRNVLFKHLHFSNCTISTMNFYNAFIAL